MNARADEIFSHLDILGELNTSIPLNHKLHVIHRALNMQFDFVDRIAVALYDAPTDVLKTFVHSTAGGEQPLSHYESKLSESQSLLEVVQQKKPRVINDLAIFSNSVHTHTKKIAAHGFASSYTLPILQNDSLLGFVFINSKQKEVFKSSELYFFDIYAHLISLVVINEQSSIQTLQATVKMAYDMTHYRDIETGNHVNRMSRFSRLIAKKLAEQYELNDEFIEHVYIFSPLHDIGKIAIPDSILHKPGALDDQERAIMKTHVVKGREIIDRILQDAGLHTLDNTDILRNIAQYHHEAVNGSGYPHGLSGENIPLEARIVAVADVFDALASKRPYKEAWPNDKAFATLRRMATHTLDAQCVEALVNSQPEVEEIQRQFNEGEVCYPNQN
ncbi:MAG: HD domain-containing protein [Gammaproteobacteria bacterium]|jgi:HD-GYP domain-containing protein (c-di-GMP phosphodiesterase class II)